MSGRHGDMVQLGTARSGTVPTRPDTVRHGPAWRGLAWQIEVRGLADRSAGLANRSEGLANRSEALGGRAGLGPVDKDEGLGAGLARALSIKVRAWGPGQPMQTLSIKVRGWGPGRPGTAKPLADTVHRGLARNIPD